MHPINRFGKRTLLTCFFFFLLSGIFFIGTGKNILPDWASYLAGTAGFIGFVLWKGINFPPKK